MSSQWFYMISHPFHWHPVAICNSPTSPGSMPQKLIKHHASRIGEAKDSGIPRWNYTFEDAIGKTWRTRKPSKTTTTRGWRSSRWNRGSGSWKESWPGWNLDFEQIRGGSTFIDKLIDSYGVWFSYMITVFIMYICFNEVRIFAATGSPKGYTVKLKTIVDWFWCTIPETNRKST